ncbi:MAG: hypothetical protein RLZZ316_2239 [Bacteroidota bacterium]|jgi:hypothetical protein
MKSIITLSFALTTITAVAQIPEDALKFSWNAPNGTARNQAIGGAMGSLGGDISATFVNPAGLGFFKTNEMVFSPGFSFIKNKSNFRGSEASDKGKGFNLGTSGFVFGGSNRYSRWTSSAVSIAVSRTANFNNKIFYKGGNNFSSYGEQWAAEVANSGLTLDQVLNSSNVSLGARMAVYSYLIDTLTIPGNSTKDIVSMALWNNLKNGAGYLTEQTNSIETRGGITEVALGFASNMDDKIYLGASVGLPIVNYERTSTFMEKDATGNANNNFDYSELKETYTTKGIGLNLKLGAIFKPADQVRIGLAVHSPTIYGLKDTYEASMTTNTENYPPSPGIVTVNTSTFTNGGPASYKYDLVNPWRALLSASYVLREVEDITRQKGFLTADIEYVNYKSNRYSTAETNNDNTYYNGVNTAIKDFYKGAFNFRAGGELKFKTIMARAGFAYYGNPYKEREELKGRRMFISGGLGYRNKGIFADLTYTHQLNRDVNFPYRLPDKANTFAYMKGSGGNIGATIGFKF